MKDLNFEWTPGGLDLLKRIKSIIEDNGGRAAMHDIVNAELNQTRYWNVKVREQEVFRLTLRHNVPYKQACNLIPMPYHMFTKKISEYKKSKIY